MTDSSDDYEDEEEEDFDEEEQSRSQQSKGLDSIDDSDLDYDDDSESTTDSYVYPWPTSSDDSWQDISSDEVIQKILVKLPQYDPPDPDADNSDEDDGYSRELEQHLSSHSDSFVERDDANLLDQQQRAAQYHASKGIT